MQASIIVVVFAVLLPPTAPINVPKEPSTNTTPTSTSYGSVWKVLITLRAALTYGESLHGKVSGYSADHLQDT